LRRLSQERRKLLDLDSVARVSIGLIRSVTPKKRQSVRLTENPLEKRKRLPPQRKLL
jgi:hypothetical protein